MSLHCTVLIPAYNTSNYIGDALKSVFTQLYKDWDILVIDDGSTDKLTTVVEYYMRQEERISLISVPHGGVTKATKVGIENATGPIITILDSDDLLLEDSLGRVVPLFAQNKKLGFVWTGFMNMRGKYGWTRDLPYHTSLFDAIVHKGWWKAGVQQFFKKKVYDRSRGLDSNIQFASDLQLAVILGETGCKTQFMQKAVYIYRQFNESRRISTGNRNKQYKCSKRIIEIARKRQRRKK